MWIKRVYDKLPATLQNLAISIYGWKRERDRYGGNFAKRYQLFCDIEYMDGQYIEEFQIAEFKKLLFEADKSRYYHSLFETAKIDIASICSLSDIKRIPILEKSYLLGHENEFYTSDGKNCLTFHTSGSTGTPLTIRMRKSDFRDRMAMLERLKQHYGITRGKRHITFVGKIITPGSNKVFWRYNAFGNQMVMSIYDLEGKNKDQYLTKMRQYHPYMIEGYPSVLNIVSKWILDSGAAIETRAVFVTAETLLDEQRQNIESAFHCPVVNYYGSMEGSPLITQCEYGELHLNYESGIVEFLREDGSDAEPGELANMIVTSFGSKETPLIRYSIGDMATYSKAKCLCQRNSLVIKEIVGRTDDIFCTPYKQNVCRLSTSLKLLPSTVRRAQLQQHAPTEFVLLLETESGITQKAIQPAIYDLKSKLGEVNILVRFIDKIPCSANGKFRSQVKCFK